MPKLKDKSVTVLQDKFSPSPKSNPEKAVGWKLVAEKILSDIAPQLREDLANGLDMEDLYLKYAPLAAARAITIALTSENERYAMEAVRHIADFITKLQGSGSLKKAQTLDISGDLDEELAKTLREIPPEVLKSFYDESEESEQD